jgi:hypothetical protein
MASVRSRIAVVAVALGLFVAAALVGDHGAARAAVGDWTGPLIGSSAPGAAILSAQGMAPGDVRTGEITLTNVGDIAGAFALGTTGVSGAPLTQQLDLSVRDLTAGYGVYTGKLAGLTSVGLGTLAQGESHRYRFVISLPSSTGDSYQGAAGGVTFTWTATAPNVAPATPPTTPAPSSGAPVGTSSPPPNDSTPVKTAVAGTTAKPTATLSARGSQNTSSGTVIAGVSCQAACKIVVDGTAKVGRTKVKLHVTRKTLRKAGKVKLRLKLPADARLAVESHRSVVVSLRLRATMGTRVLTSRRTIRVGYLRR